MWEGLVKTFWAWSLFFIRVRYSDVHETRGRRQWSSDGDSRWETSVAGGWTEMSLRRWERWVVVRTLNVRDGSFLQLMRSFSFSQCKDFRIVVAWENFCKKNCKNRLRGKFTTKISNFGLAILGPVSSHFENHNSEIWSESADQELPPARQIW